MEKVSVDDVDNRIMPAAVMRPLTDALGAEDLAINYYELEPGDSFAFAYHKHGVQEEVFYVQAGTATFETDDGEVTVGPGEAVRFPPGEFQQGWNEGDERVVGLALGAPLEYGGIVRLRHCPDCGEETDNRLDRREPAESATDGEDVVAICKECGTRTGHWTAGSTEGRVD